MENTKSTGLIAGRLFLALVFLAGATYNSFVTLKAPATELGRLIDLAPLTVIRDLANSLVIPHATLFAIGVIIFEVSVAVGFLLPVVIRRRAYVASLAFFVVLIPLIGWYALTNLIWAIPALVLLRKEDPAPAIGAP